MSAWTEHVAKWKDCQLCPLSQQRTNIVLARGTVPCRVLFIGEAPGASEDALGVPFCGPAGHLLDQIIDRSVPKDVTFALTNLVCCFPREAKERGENEPHYSEIMACKPRLKEFVDLCDPDLIVCVGSLANEYFGMGGARRKCSIVHPASILQMPVAQKRMAAQKAVVVVRNAIGGMLQTPPENKSETYSGEDLFDLPF